MNDFYLEDEIDDSIVEMYSDEGYNFIGFNYVNIPWYKCNISCECTEKKPMTKIEHIVCKCVDRFINTTSDIAFVLALDKDIVDGIVNILFKMDIFYIEDDCIYFTQKGKKYYSESLKEEIEIKEFIIYVNSVDGKIEYQDLNLLSNEEIKQQIEQGEIQISPLTTIVNTDIIENEDLKTNLENDFIINKVEILEGNKLGYKKAQIFFYKDKHKRFKFLIYDIDVEEIDFDLTRALSLMYDKKELLEIMKLEKHLSKYDELYDNYPKEVKSTKYIRNKEIREKFKGIFDEAESSIFIVSPWINDNVLNEQMKSKMENALKRGVNLSIGYSIVDKETFKKMEYSYEVNGQKFDRYSSNDKNYITHCEAMGLKERFNKYDNFEIFYVGTHEKILSYDEKYTYIGSCNLLSYDGGERNGYKEDVCRFEGGTIIEDEEFAKDVVNQIKGTAVASELH